MIADVNIDLSRWPFRRLPCDELPALIAKLRSCGVTEAWAGSFDALLHEDIGGVNARLVEACGTAPAGLLRPFGAVNPMLPDWREDLRRCHEEYGMPGIRLHPNYHGYELDTPDFAELLTLASKRGLVVQLAVRMEDPRTQHPLMQVPDVDVGPLPQLVAATPGLRLVMLNALQTVRGGVLAKLVQAGQVYFEIATQEGVGGISNLCERIPASRILFGSHFPFFVLESALLKMQESDLDPAVAEAIAHENARRLLEGNATGS